MYFFRTVIGGIIHNLPVFLGLLMVGYIYYQNMVITNQEEKIQEQKEEIAYVSGYTNELKKTVKIEQDRINEFLEDKVNLNERVADSVDKIDILQETLIEKIREINSEQIGTTCEQGLEWLYEKLK